MKIFIIDYSYLPIIDVGDLNETIYINENFQQLFLSSISKEEITNEIIKTIESPKMSGKQLNCDKIKFLDFNYSYFVIDKEGNWNFKIYEIEEFCKKMIFN